MSETKERLIQASELNGEIISLDNIGRCVIFNISNGIMKCENDTSSFMVKYSNSFIKCPYPSTFLHSNLKWNSDMVNTFIKQQFGINKCSKCGYLIDKRMEKSIYKSKQYCHECAKSWFRCPICRQVVPYHKTLIEPQKVYVCTSCYKKLFNNTVANDNPSNLHDYGYYSKMGWSREDFETFIFLCEQMRYSLILRNTDSVKSTPNFSLEIFSVCDEIFLHSLYKIAELYCPNQLDGLSEQSNVINSGFSMFMPKSFTNWPDGHLLLEEHVFREYVENFFDSLKKGVLQFTDYYNTDAEDIIEIRKEDYCLAIKSFEKQPDLSTINDYSSMCFYHDKIDWMDDQKNKLLKLSPLFCLGKNNIEIKHHHDDKVHNKDILYVCKGKIRCEINKHDIKSVSIDVSTQLSKTANLNASYCNKCQLLFMHYEEYERFRLLYGLPNIQFRPMQSDQSPFDSWEDFSVLNLAGYTVNERKGLSDGERHDILRYLLENNIMQKHEIINYLNGFITLRKDNPSMESAIEKWENDLTFIRNFSFDKQEKIHANAVKKYR